MVAPTLFSFSFFSLGTMQGVSLPTLRLQTNHPFCLYQQLTKNWR